MDRVDDVAGVRGHRADRYLIGTTDDPPGPRVRWLYTRPEVLRQGVALALTGAFARRALLDDCLEIADLLQAIRPRR